MRPTSVAKRKNERVSTMSSIRRSECREDHQDLGPGGPARWSTDDNARGRRLAPPVLDLHFVVRLLAHTGGRGFSVIGGGVPGGIPPPGTMIGTCTGELMSASTE